jgi:hypothetical protein
VIVSRDVRPADHYPFEQGILRQSITGYIEKTPVPVAGQPADGDQPG